MLHGATLHHIFPILDERGVADDMAVLAASLIGPMQVAGRLAMMVAQRRVTNHGVAVGGFVVMTLAVMVLLTDGSTPMSLVLFVTLFGGAYGTVSIIRPFIARDILGGDSFGSKSGALALLYLAGSASAPHVGSLLWDAGGYDLMLSVLIVLGVVGCGPYSIAHVMTGRRRT